MVIQDPLLDTWHAVRHLASMNVVKLAESMSATAVQDMSSCQMGILVKASFFAIKSLNMDAIVSFCKFKAYICSFILPLLKRLCISDLLIDKPLLCKYNWLCQESYKHG